MLSRINIFHIIFSHLRTLRNLNQREGWISVKDIILFYIIPFVISVFLAYKTLHIYSQVGNLISAISILGGFLFNLLSIIYGQIDKLKADAEINKDQDLKFLKTVFIKEINTNISYSILLSIVIVIALISYSLTENCNETFVFYPFLKVKKVLLCINYFLLSHFLLTLLLVLNRVFILYKKDTENL